MRCYFIRVNGKTLHENPKDKKCYVAEEPISFKRNGYSNYLPYCLENNIVRMGWPDVGDLRTNNRSGAKSNCYDLNDQSVIKPYIRDYLVEFSRIQIGSIILVPDRDHSGDIYICKVVKPYWYDPSGPYECSHRVGVLWDQDSAHFPIVYTSEQLGISRGGWWLKAFFVVTDMSKIARIDMIRGKNSKS